MITRGLIIIGALLVLGGVNKSIFDKEKIKADGEMVFLDLMPRDPRSIMQGDYMALRFRLADEIDATLHDFDHSISASARASKYELVTLEKVEGKFKIAYIRLDAKRIASLAPVGAQSESNGTLRFRYRIRNNQVWLGTNAFFFPEGSEARFAPARYGEFRVDQETGEAVLVGLRDEQLKAL